MNITLEGHPAHKVTRLPLNNRPVYYCYGCGHPMVEWDMVVIRPLGGKTGTVRLVHTGPCPDDV